MRPPPAAAARSAAESNRKGRSSLTATSMSSGSLGSGPGSSLTSIWPKSCRSQLTPWRRRRFWPARPHPTSGCLRHPRRANRASKNVPGRRRLWQRCARASARRWAASSLLSGLAMHGTRLAGTRRPLLLKAGAKVIVRVMTGRREGCRAARPARAQAAHDAALHHQQHGQRHRRVAPGFQHDGGGGQHRHRRDKERGRRPGRSAAAAGQPTAAPQSTGRRSAPDCCPAAGRRPHPRQSRYRTAWRADPWRHWRKGTRSKAWAVDLI